MIWDNLKQELTSVPGVLRWMEACRRYSERAKYKYRRYTVTRTTSGSLMKIVRRTAGSSSFSRKYLSPRRGFLIDMASQLRGSDCLGLTTGKLYQSYVFLPVAMYQNSRDWLLGSPERQRIGRIITYSSLVKRRTSIDRSP